MTTQTTKPAVKNAWAYSTVEEGYYRNDRTCDNCYTTIINHILKGKRVPSVVTCPNCGCETDGKIYNDR